MMHARRLLPVACWSVVALVTGIAGCLSTDNTPPAPADGGGGTSDLDSGHPASPGDGGPDAAAPVDGSIPPGNDGSAPNDASGDANPTVVFPDLTGGTFLTGAASKDGSVILVIQANLAAHPTIPSKLLFARFTPSTGWSDVKGIPGVTASSIQDPKLGIDDSGNAFLAFVDGNTTGNYTLAVMRYDVATAAWSAEQKPDTYAQNTNQQTGLAVNGAGDALLLELHEGATAPFDVVIQHYAHGTGTWTQETVMTSAANTNGGAPFVALASTGAAVATFTISSVTHVATRSAAGVWTAAPTTLSAIFSYKEGIAINDAGDVIIGYENTATQPTVYQYDAAGNAWSGPTVLGAETQGAEGQSGYVTGITPTGDATYARAYYGGTKTTLEGYAYTKSNKTWSTVKTLPPTNFFGSDNFAFAGDGSGLAVYVDLPTASFQEAPILASTFSPATGWSAQPTKLADAGVYLTAFASPAGAKWAAWSDQATTHTSVALVP